MPGPDWVWTPKDGDYLGYGARDFANLTDMEKAFCAGHDRATTIAESEDPFADYGYYDWALAELDGVFYAFETSGCSCPSPYETWSLRFHGTRDAMLDWLHVVAQDPRHEDAGEAFNEFLRKIEAAGWELRAPAPAPRSSRYDW